MAFVSEAAVALASEPVTDSSANTPTATFLAAMLAVPHGLWTVEAGHAFADIGAAIHTGAATLNFQTWRHIVFHPDYVLAALVFHAPKQPQNSVHLQDDGAFGIACLCGPKIIEPVTEELVCWSSESKELGSAASRSRAKAATFSLAEYMARLCVYVWACVYAPHLHICRK